MTFNEEKRGNILTVTGKVESTEIRKGTGTKGRYVAGTINIKAGEDVFIVNMYQGEKYGNGNDNPNFLAFQELVNGQRISVSGNLTQNRYYSSENKEIRSSQRIDGRFINTPRQNDEDGLIFEYTGFVTSPIREITNAEGEIERYEFKLAQAKYRSEQGVDVIAFSVDPKNTSILNGIESNYTVGATARISGRGKSVIVTSQKPAQGLFGEDVAPVSQSVFTAFFVAGGKHVLESQTYTAEEIDFLTKATQDNDVAIKEAAITKSKEKSAASTGAGSFGEGTGATKSKASILGL